MAKSIRIVGGQDAPEPIPWQVNVMFRHQPKCGGTILDHSTILTAGHCFLHNGIIDTDPRNYTISVGTVAGFPPQDRDTPHDIILYPGYSHKSKFEDDIAIIKLKDKMDFSINVKPACLPSLNYNENDCYVSGWGYTIPNPGKEPFHIII